MNNSIFKGTMAEMNWRDLEEKGRAKVPVLLPMGVIEEHGPHLPLATDVLYSCAICHMIREALEKRKMDCLIAPPFYWGINHCTGAFPGSFSVQPETLKMILHDIFVNLHQFGFDQVYCANYHGDPLHVTTILESIKNTNKKYGMQIRLMIEPYDLHQFQLTGLEDYILVDKAEYPEEIFEMFALDEEKKLYDIHAGAFETAAMEFFYPDSICRKLTKTLPSCSLTQEKLYQWFTGGKAVRDIVPLGYAGNPAIFEEKLDRIKVMFNILVDYYADRIIDMKKQ